MLLVLISIINFIFLIPKFVVVSSLEISKTTPEIIERIIQIKVPLNNTECTDEINGTNIIEKESDEILQKTEEFRNKLISYFDKTKQQGGRPASYGTVRIHDYFCDYFRLNIYYYLNVRVSEEGKISVDDGQDDDRDYNYKDGGLTGSNNGVNQNKDTSDDKKQDKNLNGNAQMGDDFFSYNDQLKYISNQMTQELKEEILPKHIKANAVGSDWSIEPWAPNVRVWWVR